MLDELIAKINRAKVVIPKKFFVIKDGSAYAYSQGVLDGRAQAVEIIKKEYIEAGKQTLF